MADYDFDTIDDIDDADDDSVHLLVFDREAGEFVWAWVMRETLAEAGYIDISDYGM
ncbi:hypothetical protein [Chelatococcus asaccharovorans]|uniref:Uncharacterized protein n=1 Tax=Chelatococcus asaccharovorans TaxID=28210 RepID=A0A2V3U142_9HYPH|nr:hypothetical protein [Chelatococcus asaccharovorans]MBS7702654.1 hypothetical protein [Chelatococcus asaccharovorans]PXW50190.1 hypothetical protein C7450_1302 [Chelatococcus asaccharovorans]